jgi:hypothetical protein
VEITSHDIRIDIHKYSSQSQCEANLIKVIKDLI